MVSLIEGRSKLPFISQYLKGHSSLSEKKNVLVLVKGKTTITTNKEQEDVVTAQEPLPPSSSAVVVQSLIHV